MSDFTSQKLSNVFSTTGPVGQVLTAGSNYDVTITVGSGWRSGSFHVRSPNASGISAGLANVNVAAGQIRFANNSNSYATSVYLAGVYSSGYSRLTDSTLSPSVWNTTAITISLVDVWFDAGVVTFRFNNAAGVSNTLASSIRFVVDMVP